MEGESTAVGVIAYYGSGAVCRKVFWEEMCLLG